MAKISTSKKMDPFHLKKNSKTGSFAMFNML